jgi:hypothetical protein
MIIHVPAHHSADPPTTLLKIGVEAVPDLPFHGQELDTKALGNGITTDGEMTAIPGTPTDMGGTQEIEGLRPGGSPKTAVLDRKAAELDEPGLSGGRRERPKVARRSRRSSKKRRTSQLCWNPKTKSSAYRTP